MYIYQVPYTYTRYVTVPIYQVGVARHLYGMFAFTSCLLSRVLEVVLLYVGVVMHLYGMCLFISC